MKHALHPRPAPALLGICLAAAALLPLPGHALAASSEWAVNEGGRMRLVLMPADGEGLREGALVIEPNPGWITYWKEPGDAGIPPAITLAPGSAATLETIQFPVPKLIENGELRDVGYDHAVALPLTIRESAETAGQPLSVTAFIGLCRNICIPFQAELTVPAEEASAGMTASAGSSGEAAAVAAAKASLPAAPSADFALTGYAMRSDLKQLDLTLRLPAGAGAPQVFVSGPSGHVFLDGEVTRAENGAVSVSVPISKLPKTYTLPGKRWGILVLAGGRAMETTLAFD
jgi:DsbC/DsbD-like thiol-disulfide interchange protein